ncbi:Thiamine phosphate synthase/TenI [Candidatus Pelagibacterales bacterium]
MKKINKIFIYADNVTNQLKLATSKCKNFSLIYRNYTKKFDSSLIDVMNFCKRNKIPIFVNYKRDILKYKFDGFYIPSFEKNFIYTNKLRLGSAHSYREIYQKINQQCKIIFISPLFENLKNKKPLGVVKFNLLIMNFKAKFYALGGINKSNINLIFKTKSQGVGGIRIIDDLNLLKKVTQLKFSNNLGNDSL